MKSFSKTLFLDIFFLLPVLVVCFILLGSYLRFEYLDTGYPDWFMHAFRARSLDLHGLSSWTHSWSNGMSFWATYQFISHYFVLGISQLTNVAITKGMIYATFISFVLTRVFMYIALRQLGVSRLYSLLGVLLTFVAAQQWITIKDFSIYIPIMFTPLYVLLWVKTYHNLRLVYISGALFGLSWLLHPIFGLTLSILFVTLLLAKRSSLGVYQTVLSALIFTLAASPFLVETMLLEVYSNPYLKTTQFLRQLISSPFMGLSQILAFVLIITNILWITKVSKLSQWVTVFWFYILFMLLLIHLSLQGLMPDFFNSLQLPRAITIVSLFIPMVFVMTLQAHMYKYNKALLALLAIFIAIILSQGIAIAGTYTAVPTNDRINAVTSYFADQVPEGRVFYDGLTEANYFANQNIRYVNSYAEHMEPHPLARRFKQLIELPSVMRIVPDSHIALVSDYARVLGVEYLFLAKSSPLINSITQGENPPFVVVENKIEDSNGLYTVLKANYPVANAVVYNPGETPLSIFSLSAPQVDTRTYDQWDKEVSRVAELLRSNETRIAHVNFSDPEKIEINLENIDIANKHIFVNTSFSPNWHSKQVEIRPTALEFMELKMNTTDNTITLEHKWPNWKAPLYAASVSTLGFGGGLYALTKKKHQ